LSEATAEAQALVFLGEQEARNAKAPAFYSLRRRRRKGHLLLSCNS